MTRSFLGVVTATGRRSLHCPHLYIRLRAKSEILYYKLRRKDLAWSDTIVRDSVVFGQHVLSRQRHQDHAAAQRAGTGGNRPKMPIADTPDEAGITSLDRAVSERLSLQWSATQSFGAYDVQRDDWKPPLCVQRSQDTPGQGLADSQRRPTGRCC